MPTSTTEPATGNELVSIIVAAYNAEKFVAAAIDSCLDQTYPHLEVLVVDDGSTDGTSAILAGYGDRIRVVRQRNGGLANARNTGVRESRGAYIAWMDADDLAHPERVSMQLAAFKACPRLVLVSSDFSAFHSEAEGDFEASHIETYYDAYHRLGAHSSIYPERVSLPAGVVHVGQVPNKLLWGNFVHPPTVMVTRAAMQRAGMFDESLRYSSDYDLILRLAGLGPFGYLNSPLLRYRRGPHQMSGATSHGHMQFETLRILDRFVPAAQSKGRSVRRLLRRRKSETLVSAASVIGPGDRRRAFRLLVDGWRFGFPVKQSVVALARIAMPDRMRNLVRRLVRRDSVQWS